MHVVLCYPFLDLRFLTGAAPRPAWIDGSFETVGSFGPVLRGAFDGAEGEIRANAALAFGHERNRRIELAGRGGRLRQRAKPVQLDSGFAVTDRSLLADGDGHVRLELIAASPDEPPPGGLADRLESLMTTNVYVVRTGDSELINAGFRVARLYLEQSAKTTIPPTDPVATQLLREGAGSPFLVVLHDGPAPASPEGSPLQEKPPQFEAVTCQLLRLAGRSTGVWRIWGGGGFGQWRDPVRMLCRIVCQLSEVTSLAALQQDPSALAPHMLDPALVEQFFRIRTSQLTRTRQGVWAVAAVQPLASQHLKVGTDEVPHSVEALTGFLRRDQAGTLSQTLESISRRSADAPLLLEGDRKRLAQIAAAQGVGGACVELDGRPIDARGQALALERTLSADAGSAVTLGQLLLPELDRLGVDDAATVVATVSRYNLIHDPAELRNLQIRYQVPVPSNAPPRDAGPDIDWHGPNDDLELQGLFGADPPDYLEVGYLIDAIRNAASVCRVDVGATGEGGTGVVIAPRLILTNHHVVKDVLAGGSAAGRADTVRLTFGSFSRTADPIELALDAQQPILASSPTEKLDYALLKAAPAIDEAKSIRAATIGVAAPGLRAPLSILQHPDGGSMKLAPSTNAVTWVDPARGTIQYVTRTSHGSSGAPCFDEAWRLVAIHHAQRARTVGSIREGILIGSIRNEIRMHLPE